ncbi:hypothetical protein DAPPUDRAFT_245061 [Daphnia pulex]|uniref:Thioester reductase (TE) domain-containing protein n=1 Tax=Daphnia pulex TaxID=6669 RepID=E9GMH2_DAPPU|nr:hypothetical protein DAPPUDRAFT_245061 [Daphnia pulex]|eukprot:EFX79365.1 hypothetical protein DAPPUDRAFT_245061 [Daphnia pulex]
MQTNYFGHFFLTNLLLGLLKKSAPSRIINVTSVAHSFIKTFDLNNLNVDLYHNGSSFYNSIYYYSKLSIILSTRHLAHLISQSAKGYSEYIIAANEVPDAVKTIEISYGISSGIRSNLLQQ